METADDSPGLSGLVSLVGRERERAELRALVRESRVVLVYGAAGVGKTSLVLDVCREAAREGLVPPVIHLSVAGITDAREALERTARIVGEPRPTPTPDRIPEALVALLTGTPRTIVWDDLDERSGILSEMVKRFLASAGPARIVLMSRRFFTAREAMLRAPVYEVKPLAHEDAVRLVRIIEAQRGRTLADDLATATGGNPLLLRVALAENALPRVAVDATEALRRSLEERSTGTARKVLVLLAAAETSLDEAEVAREAGRGGREAIDDLRKHLLVVREGSRIGLSPTVSAIAHDAVRDPRVAKAIPEADVATWKSLAKLAARALAAAAHDDAALLLAARAHVELGAADGALLALREHAIARAALATADLERLVRDIAVRSPGAAGGALRMLARELLRVGDYEAARRTLDDLPKPRSREEAERVALLRAESHIRAGEPDAAQRALDALDALVGTEAKRPTATRKRGAHRTKSVTAPAGEENPGIVLTRAQLAILRGELASSRATLEQLAPRTLDVPQLEARRAVEIAASHLYEERYDVTHAWTRRARGAQKAAGIPVERVVTILDVHALLGLGEVERAEEVLAREARGGPDAMILEIATLVRRGAYARALEVGDAAIATLDRRADLLFRSVLARDLTRACIGTGQLARAARMLKLAEAAGDEPGLAALQPICDAERARLAEAEGDVARARRAIDRAYARIPASPFVSVDRDVMTGRVPLLAASAKRASRPSFESSDEASPMARAYASLRAAELAVATGQLGAALDAAENAERFHVTARLAYETARARLVRAEVLVRMLLDAASTTGAEERAALRARADDALAACDDVAAPNGYAMVLVGSALVRAALAESSGDLEAARASLDAALGMAGETADSSLQRAAARLGVETASRAAANAALEGATSVRRPYAARIERLGLLRAADVVWRVGPRAYLALRDDAPPEPVSCVVDLEARAVEASGGRTLDLPEQRIALLSVLAEAGDAGAALEDIFARVWGGTFHPLRHRNAVYVALARLKDSLKPLARDVQISHDGDRYRLRGTLPVGVRRKAVPAALGRSAER